MGFFAFLGRNAGATVVGSVGIVLAALGFLDQAGDIVTSFAPWELQALGAAIFVVSVVMILYRYDQAHQAREETPSLAPKVELAPLDYASNPPALAAPDSQGRAVVGASVTPEYLMGLFKGQTHAQALKLIEAYLGRWIQTTLTVSNVYPITDVTHVSAKFDEAMKTVWLSFLDTQLPRVECLTIDERITIIGRIKEIRRYDLTLEMCEFVA